ncbi:MAG: hypothetical protein WC889_08820 [Myxococcota bacterium]
MYLKSGRRWLRRAILASAAAGVLYLAGCMQPAAYGPGNSCKTDDDCSWLLNGQCVEVNNYYVCKSGQPDGGGGDM